MAEIKLEITDEMIAKAIRAQIKEKLRNMDLKGMVNTEIVKMVHESWKEIKAENLVKELKTNEIANRVVENITSTIIDAFENNC